MNFRLQIPLSANIFALLAAASVHATELCVKCTDPNASYACIVGNTSNATLDTVSKFYCITSLAKSGSHASCVIDRNLNPPCPGERRELPIPAFLNDSEDDNQHHDTTSVGPHQKDPQNQGAANQSPSSTQATSEQAPHSPQNSQADDAPPKTVEEMMAKGAKSAGDGLSQTQKSAGDAAKSASTALEKAGSAVGGAAKSSWKCLSSFFSNC